MIVDYPLLSLFTSYTCRYFQCFLDRAPFSLCLRLWDAYILDGERVLVAMGFLLMKLHKKNILKGQFEDVMRLLNDQLVNVRGPAFLVTSLAVIYRSIPALTLLISLAQQ